MVYLIIIAVLVFAFITYKVLGNKKTKVKKGNGYGGGNSPINKDQKHR